MAERQPLPSWDRVAELVSALAGLPPAERAAALERQCGSDAALRAEVESLLSHHDEPLDFLERPALGRSFTVAAASDDPADDPILGRRLGVYRVDARVGSGGMGSVYRGSRQDGLVEQTVAIKLVHPWRCTPEVVARFQREWQALAALSHPQIAKLLDAGLADDGTPFLIMDFVEGRPIDEHCDALRLTVPQRLELVERVARVVHYAHQNLIVHRDLKPANILVTAAGDPVLLDFGIAKMLQPGAAAAPTATRAAMMTPDYASPEQIRGEAPTTGSDVYSLGVLLYELLVGCRPYRFTTRSVAAMRSVLDDREPARPSTRVRQAGEPAGVESEPSGAAAVGAVELAERRGTTPRRLYRLLRGELDNVVLMAMRKDPARRYGSAEQLAADLRRHRAGLPVAARPDTWRYRGAKFLLRNRAVVALAAIAVTALVAGSVATWRQALVAAREAEHAGIEARSAQRLADVVVDALLASTPEQADVQRDRIERLLAQHAAAARRELAHRPHVRANLIDALGRVCGRLGQHDAALALVDEAAGVRREAFGEQSLEWALSESSRGELAVRRSDYAAAREHFARALQLQQALPVGVHTDVGRAYNDLAVAERALGNVGRAEELHHAALDVRRGAHGARTVAVAESLNNLAMIHLARGALPLAVRDLTEALAIRREQLGAGHPLVAQSLNNLAGVQQRQGDTAAAQATLEQAVRSYAEQAVADPEAFGRTLTNLAEVMALRGDDSGALQRAEEALAMRREHHGDDAHPSVARAQLVVAKLEGRLGRHADALPRFEAALAVLRSALPAGGDRFAAALCSHGTALLAAGRTADAESVYRDAIAQMRAADTKRADLRGAALLGLAVVLQRDGRAAEAVPFARQAAECFGERFPAQAQRARELLVALGG